MCFRHYLVFYIQLFSSAFLGSLLKDIKSERPKITEKDNLRLLFVTQWFLEFFSAAKRVERGSWSPKFEMVTEVVDRNWIVWVLRRMRGALDEKVRFVVTRSPVCILKRMFSPNNGSNYKLALNV